MLEHSQLIYVKRAPGKGRGVFAKTDIAKGVVIEQVPKFLVPIDTIVNGFDNPFLPCLYFLHDDKHVAVCLGYGSLYNHSYKPNALYEEGSNNTMIFRAHKNIPAGEEICVNYNGFPTGKSSMGFDVV